MVSKIFLNLYSTVKTVYPPEQKADMLIAHHKRFEFAEVRLLPSTSNSFALP